MLLSNKIITLLLSLSLLPLNLVAAQDAPFARTVCSPSECGRFCAGGTASSKSKFKLRSLFPTITTGGALSSQWLRLKKRFYSPDDPNQLVNELLDPLNPDTRYTNNMCPSDDAGTTYYWQDFGTTEYASAIKGLCGCTAILIASDTGVFSSHIWEVDTNHQYDIQNANYNATMEQLAENLSPHAAALAGGEAWLIIPTQPNSGARLLYNPQVVAALQATIQSASGLTPTVSTYIPLDCEHSPNLGFTERGTVCVQYDPAYTPPGGIEGRAYRLWNQNTQLSERTWGGDVPVPDPGPGTGPGKHY